MPTRLLMESSAAAEVAKDSAWTGAGYLDCLGIFYGGTSTKAICEANATIGHRFRRACS
jgi:hypothetical protein